MREAKPDQRRATGLRTRARLMDAALGLLSDRGEDGVTLREVTDAADANVAAVSYHFGSLGSLCDAAIEHALERYLDAQQEAVSELDPDAPLDALSAAFARPLVASLAAGGRDLAVMRIVARAGIDAPAGSGRLDVRFEQIRGAVLRVLKANIDGVKDQELIFRIRCVAGLINWLVLAPVANELRHKSEKQIERLLVPVLVGAFRATADPHASTNRTGEQGQEVVQL
jgi:AcrR family transcriptional regulator